MNEIVVPDLPTTIVVWRAWRTDPANRSPLLYSLSLLSGEPCKWPPKTKLVAQCYRRRLNPFWQFELHLMASQPHDPPGEYCECGICGLRELWRLFSDRYMLNLFARLYPNIAFGRAELWGPYWPHQYGVRALYGYPQELYLPQPILYRAAAISAAYDIPVRGLNELEVEEAADGKFFESLLQDIRLSSLELQFANDTSSAS